MIFAEYDENENILSLCTDLGQMHSFRMGAETVAKVRKKIQQKDSDDQIIAWIRNMDPVTVWTENFAPNNDTVNSWVMNNRNMLWDLHQNGSINDTNKDQIIDFIDYCLSPDFVNEYLPTDTLILWFIRHSGYKIKHSIQFHNGLLTLYKGLSSDERSTRAGSAIVDGQVINGRIKNLNGSVIEMDPDQIVDRHTLCGPGLHVATFGFASTFGSLVKEITVRPEDIVVISDIQDNKIRVCRYTVESKV